MDPVTASKIQVLGSVDDDEVRAALLDEVAKEDLPDFLGGERRGASCPVFYKLRVGEHPIDEEVEVHLAAGRATVRVASITPAMMAAAAAAAAGAHEARADCLELLVRSHNGGARLEVRWLRGGVAIEPSQQLDVNTAGQAVLVPLPAGIGGNGGDDGAGMLELQLSFISENYYRSCVCLFELSGVSPEAWVERPA